uniref:Sugar phosphate transporter domain-containing protein n=1 Tax=Spongospora subterranea TaxID=70186 RepID=A0A0H5RB84_9EUKA|eukprot:CRZ11278.1 hypothetical protein [Spongospora subterranea]
MPSPLVCLDHDRLRSYDYQEFICELINELHRCTDLMNDVKVVVDHSREDLIAFIAKNKTILDVLMAVVDVSASGDAGNNSLELNIFDNRLDLHLYEFHKAATNLLAKLNALPTSDAQRRLRLLILCVFCVVAFFISTCIAYSTGVIKRYYHVKKPFFIATVESLCVGVNGLIWGGAVLWKRYRCPGGRPAGTNLGFVSRIREYLLIGLIDGGHIILQSFALNSLPSSIYVLLKGSGIVFSVVLSKIVVKKVFLLQHWIAVMIMIISTVSVAICTPNDKGSDAATEFYSGVAYCLSSCFVVSLLGVIQQKMMSKHKSADETIDIIAEANFAQSVLVAIIVLPATLISGEWTSWSDIATRLSDDQQLAPFLGYCTAILLARSLSVFAAMGITSFASAMFSRAYGGVRQSLQVIALSLVLHEGFHWSKSISIVLSAVAFAVYIWAGYLLQQRKKSAERKLAPATFITVMDQSGATSIK